MNGNIQTLEYHPTIEIRTVLQDGEVWWVLLDVCRALGLGSPHKVAARLDEDERNLIPVIDGVGRRQETAVINESGLYSVILRSDKPEAKAFKRWVTHEVLPSIRKTGAYSAKGVDQADTLATLPATEEQSHRTAAQHLWLVLREIDRTRGGTGTVQISNPDLLRLLGYKSRHTIISARKELEAAGLVEFVQGTKATPSTYRLKST